MCVFREVKNLERFSLVVQCITKIALIKLKELPEFLRSMPAAVKDDKESGTSKEIDKTNSKSGWTLEDVEKLLTYMSRVFMLQFPLYLAAKQAGSAKQAS